MNFVAFVRNIRCGSRGNGHRISITEGARAPLWPLMRGAWSGDMLSRKNVLDFNALKCQSLGFRVFRIGYWPGFKVKAWKIYFHFLKVIHFSKV